MSLLDAERVQVRLAVVDEHIRCENRHDLEAVMGILEPALGSMTSRGEITAVVSTACGRITLISCAHCRISPLR